ncbi:MAG: flagellar export protein FliJ [Spirochaetaceae bacterium]|nr:flagellar export protein FliJ [Spirochaetaceae bacterium]
MKQFTFTLEKIMRLRAWSEEEARIELGRVMSEKNAVEYALKNAAGKRAAAMKNRFSLSGGVDTMYAYEAYIARLDAEKENLLSNAAAIELKVEAARETWTTANAELKAIQNLRERRFKDYRKNVFTEEEKEINDIRRRA